MPAIAYMRPVRRGIAVTKEEFGARLRELRESRGLTQAELATKAGLPEGTLVQYERARREASWNAVLALADALDVSTEAFRQLPKDPIVKRKPGRPRTAKPPEGSAQNQPAEDLGEEKQPRKRRSKE